MNQPTVQVSSTSEVRTVNRTESSETSALMIPAGVGIREKQSVQVSPWFVGAGPCVSYLVTRSEERMFG